MAKVMQERRRDPAEVAQIRARPKAEPKPIPKLLAELTKKTSLERALAAMFWKLRHQNPEMAVTIDEHDVETMDRANEYMEQRPKLVIDANDRFATVRIVDAKTGDMIQIAESDETDLRKKEAAAAVRMAKERIPMLVGTVMGQINQGVTSNDSIQELCRAAELVARS